MYPVDTAEAVKFDEIFLSYTENTKATFCDVISTST